MAKSITTLFLILIICFGSSFAQGDFLESGQDGIQVAGQFSKTDGGNEVAGYFSFCLDGVLDLGFSVGKMTYDNDGIVIDGNFYGPLIIVHARKKTTRQMPLSISFLLNYAISSYPSDKTTSSQDYDLSGNHLIMGAAVYHNFKGGAEFQIQPNGMIGYANNDIKAKNGSATEENSKGGIVFGLGLSLLMGNPTKSGIRVDTGFSTYDKHTTFSVSFGVIKIP